MRVDPVCDAISSYDLEEITLATLCSHTSLQIFHGAREEGFKTLGLAIRTIPKYYDAYPRAKPDDFLSLTPTSTCLSTPPNCATETRY